MQTAIAVGTLLQNHYKIIKLLGQGGFGRTYLAEDEGRFNERCAIKEFVPIKGQDRFSDKATQLFQREASVLYQIIHPQIPKFRATFEEQERLFLVQDYVEGPTYHEVLNQRKQQGQHFSEAEVKQFIQQMLPVLAHIHAKGIIHRDISPDNIIQRQPDRLPVLIDFGVVKEVVTRMQLSPTESGNVSQATTVGKAGYAPSEQMQTGKAYPSSDLYALAVTAIVLLTGREPQALFDDINFAWNWQSLVTVSPSFAAVLNKALQYRPSDRYQSVSQMAQALQSGSAAGPSTPLSPYSPGPQQQNGASAQNLPPQNQNPPLSQIQTVAVGRPNPGATSVTPANSNRANPNRTSPNQVSRVNAPPTISQSNTRMQMPSEREQSPSFLENPFAVGALAAGLVTAAGFGGWATVRYLSSPTTPEPTITSLPPIDGEATPEPTATPEPQPAEYTQPLSLVPGVAESVEGNLLGGDTLNYLLSAEPGQTLNVTVAPEGVLLSVLGPEDRPVARNARRVAQWRGTLEDFGEYKIQLSPVRGVPSSDYQLEVVLGPVPAPPAEPEPIEPVEPPIDTTVPDPEPTPAPPTQVDIQTQRITLPNDSQGTRVTNSVGPGRLKRYVVNAKQGQILTVNVLSSEQPVSFELLMPDGTVLPDASNLERWQGFLPLGGDYSIDVTAPARSEFTIEMQLSAAIPQG